MQINKLFYKLPNIFAKKIKLLNIEKYLVKY